jgi:hypothetical protein
MFRGIANSILACAASLLLAGCNTLASGPNRISVPVRNYSGDLLRVEDPALGPSEKILSSSWNDTWLPDEKRLHRNERVTAQMHLISRAFDDYEQQFVQDMRTGGFLADFAVGALATGAAAIRDIKISRGLTTAGATILAGRSAVDKQVLLDRTMATLLNQMEASRASVEAQILDRLKLSYADYPVGLAQLDLERYYQAGTLVGALTAAADSASTRKIEAQANAAAALTGTFQTNGSSVALRAYLEAAPSPVEATRRRTLALMLLNAQRVAVGKRPISSIISFTESPAPEAEKKALLQALEAAEGGDLKKQLSDALAAIDGRKVEAQAVAGAALTGIFQVNGSSEALRAYLEAAPSAAEATRRRTLALALLNAQRVAAGKARISSVISFAESAAPEAEKKVLLQALEASETGDVKKQLTDALAAIDAPGASPK